MTHEDGTMDVMVHGKPERRRFTMQPMAFTVTTSMFGARHQFTPVPELNPGEELVWLLGSDTPLIYPGARDDHRPITFRPFGE